MSQILIIGAGAMGEAIIAGLIWRFLSPSDSILDDEPAEARAY